MMMVTPSEFESGDFHSSSEVETEEDRDHSLRNKKQQHNDNLEEVRKLADLNMLAIM